jgi:squalene-hopene/tetraprenyl-beta-curcumene cyclase
LNATDIQSRLRTALDRATAQLLAARAPEGHWLGELSSSALSTATAVTALGVVDREARTEGYVSQVFSGLEWLARHMNSDGGWGDTVKSLSNVSTTTLCWAAFGAAPGADERFQVTVRRAEQWIDRHVGGLEPALLARAIIERYGKDRTFSVPILTMCALARRLGQKREAWRHIIPLPFELAACPHQWFAALRLPVVSYALPALIAMGQARHHHLPSRNPLARWVRNLSRAKTLKVLERIQPGNGGFLEATPLTSFVTMSIAGSGQVGHLVTRRGLEFLLRSQRSDGSWPIDTNLGTWLTTLAVNAMSRNGVRPDKGQGASLSAMGDSSPEIRRWLLAQQHRVEHVYTHAAPGGWAWTDLPGGVPDGDDTAGALLALRRLGAIDDAVRDAAFAGIKWLLNLQNRDGGVPTFCRGWGALGFDRSSADITAHAIRAWAEWLADAPPPLRRRIRSALMKAQRFLVRAQRPNGSWVPLWFGNQFDPYEENGTYGTARVLTALADSTVASLEKTSTVQVLTKGLEWLLGAQKADGSWGGCAGGTPSIEETSLAVEALAAVAMPSATESTPDRLGEATRRALWRGTNWLIERVESGAWTEPAPIGFYFAKLWYYEKLYPLVFTVGALNRVADAVALPLREPSRGLRSSRHAPTVAGLGAHFQDCERLQARFDRARGNR